MFTGRGRGHRFECIGAPRNQDNRAPLARECPGERLPDLAAGAIYKSEKILFLNPQLTNSTYPLGHVNRPLIRRTMSSSITNGRASAACGSS